MAYIYEVGDVVKMKKKHFQKCQEKASELEKGYG